AHWGYRRIVGEPTGVGISVSVTSVRKVLLKAGLPPAPERARSSWRAFLLAQAAEHHDLQLLKLSERRRGALPVLEVGDKSEDLGALTGSRFTTRPPSMSWPMRYRVISVPVLQFPHEPPLAASGSYDRGSDSNEEEPGANPQAAAHSDGGQIA